MRKNSFKWIRKSQKYEERKSPDPSTSSSAADESLGEAAGWGSSTVETSSIQK